MSETFHVLVIDDEPVIRDSCLQILSRKGCEVTVASDGRTGLDLLDRYLYDAVILDVKLPDTGGEGIMEAIRRGDPGLPVIVITAYPTVEDAVGFMKTGAFDYIPKPFTPNILRGVVSKAFRVRRERMNSLQDVGGDHGHLNGIEALVGVSDAMDRIRANIRKAGMSDCSVLITGETGTGKELAARALHSSSRRRHNSFITVDSGSLVDTLAESELFGHVKGSFTGAWTDRVGRFEMANRGTLFFDEISNMSPHVQNRLLRVLQEQEFTRVGGSRMISVNVRILAATNSDLSREIHNGTFREDLFYRLNVISIHMPPLRERREDIPVLAKHFLSTVMNRKGCDMKVSIEHGALERMIAYDWPGNVRQLENVIERATVMCDRAVVDPMEYVSCRTEEQLASPDLRNTPLHLDDIERDHIEKMLESYAITIKHAQPANSV